MTLAARRSLTGRFRLLLYRYLRTLGPGFVSGASDTDPTTVATMSVVGSTTVYGLSWLTVLAYPMLATIQVTAARIGVVTRRGLQELVRSRYGRAWGLLLLASVLVVNLVTIGADLEAGAAACALLLHIDYRWLILPLAAVLLALLYYGSFQTVERVLKYVLLVLLAYIASAFLAHPRWGAIFGATVVPRLRLDSDYIAGSLAILGTTLTSYSYVWESVEESERKLPISRLGIAQADAGLGMFVAVAVFWFILIATGSTLGMEHKHVETAQQAAQALTPIAGPAAGLLFGVGLLASSVIAVPVLAASTAYLVGAEFEVPRGLSKRLGEARLFYAILTAAIIVAIAIGFAGVPPIKLLFVASVAGGLGTPISLAFLLLVARDRRIMGDHQASRWLILGGWITFALVALTGALFLLRQLAPSLLRT
jgi:Mn2+/Fe2+ NRAMP family transporter